MCTACRTTAQVQCVAAAVALTALSPQLAGAAAPAGAGITPPAGYVPVEGSGIMFLSLEGVHGISLDGTRFKTFVKWSQLPYTPCLVAHGLAVDDVLGLALWSCDDKTLFRMNLAGGVAVEQFTSTGTVFKEGVTVKPGFNLGSFCQHDGKRGWRVYEVDLQTGNRGKEIMAQQAGFRDGGGMATLDGSDWLSWNHNGEAAISKPGPAGAAPVRLDKVKEFWDREGLMADWHMGHLSTADKALYFAAVSDGTSMIVQADPNDVSDPIVLARGLPGWRTYGEPPRNLDSPPQPAFDVVPGGKVMAYANEDKIMVSALDGSNAQVLYTATAEQIVVGPLRYVTALFAPTDEPSLSPSAAPTVPPPTGSPSAGVMICSSFSKKCSPVALGAPNSISSVECELTCGKDSRPPSVSPTTSPAGRPPPCPPPAPPAPPPAPAGAYVCTLTSGCIEIAQSSPVARDWYNCTATCPPAPPPPPPPDLGDMPPPPPPPPPQPAPQGPQEPPTESPAGGKPAPKPPTSSPAAAAPPDGSAGSGSDTSGGRVAPAPPEPPSGGLTLEPGIAAVSGGGICVVGLCIGYILASRKYRAKMKEARHEAAEAEKHLALVECALPVSKPVEHKEYKDPPPPELKKAVSIRSRAPSLGNTMQRSDGGSAVPSGIKLPRASTDGQQALGPGDDEFAETFMCDPYSFHSGGAESPLKSGKYRPPRIAPGEQQPLTGEPGTPTGYERRSGSHSAGPRSSHRSEVLNEILSQEDHAHDPQQNPGLQSTNSNTSTRGRGGLHSTTIGRGTPVREHIPGEGQEHPPAFRRIDDTSGTTSRRSHGDHGAHSPGWVPPRHHKHTTRVGRDHPVLLPPQRPHAHHHHGDHSHSPTTSHGAHDLHDVLHHANEAAHHGATSPRHESGSHSPPHAHHHGTTTGSFAAALQQHVQHTHPHGSAPRSPAGASHAHHAHFADDGQHHDHHQHGPHHPVRHRRSVVGHDGHHGHGNALHTAVMRIRHGAPGGAAAGWSHAAHPGSHVHQEHSDAHGAHSPSVHSPHGAHGAHSPAVHGAHSPHAHEGHRTSPGSSPRGPAGRTGVHSVHRRASAAEEDSSLGRL
eukprot:TRINITY_DN7071_c1_g1_i2.p1 TRINITY_DN7071_c1_g1~~TRINITY_DN7071_c1_g1_i2.p1  ORF type:complete len:1092 (+),score=135.63 TRINITY_DN7071_c1_g1_i2:105-3380(+)